MANNVMNRINGYGLSDESYNLFGKVLANVCRFLNTNGILFLTSDSSGLISPSYIIIVKESDQSVEIVGDEKFYKSRSNFSYDGLSNLAKEININLQVAEL